LMLRKTEWSGATPWLAARTPADAAVPVKMQFRV
jgi:hypothetical protein